MFGYAQIGHTGTFAEKVILEECTVGAVPDDMPMDEAATLPVGLLTSALGFYHDTKLAPPGEDAAAGAGQTVVIWGAAGGVGQQAVTLAVASGYTAIIGVASTRNHDLLRRLGCTHTVPPRHSAI